MAQLVLVSQTRVWQRNAKQDNKTAKTKERKLMTAAITNPLLQAVSPLIGRALTSSDTEPKQESLPNVTGLADDFEAQLKALISPAAGNKVSEEDLFAAIIGDQIKSMKGDGQAEDYQKQLKKHMQEMTRADGYVAVEDAAKMALKDMVELGHLTKEEAKSIRANSFAAAQLDDNDKALYDGRGDGEDATVAVAEISAALSKAKAAIAAIANGELKPAETEGEDIASESVTPQGNNVDGREGFLFKPAGENDGKLVILLPTKFTGQVDEVILKDTEGNTVENGRGTGVANGGREHFRFNRPGEDYPEDLTVEIRLSNGEIVTYSIPDPSQRYD